MGYPIFWQSESALRQALRNEPQSVHKIVYGDKTACYLACNWPAGLKLLVDAGADFDTKIFYQDTPLVQAIRLRNLEIVRFLLGSGASVTDLKRIYFLGRPPGGRINFTACFDEHEWLQSPECEIANLILEASKEHRESLLETAIAILEEPEQEELGLDTSCLLDAKAADVALRLASRGTDMFPEFSALYRGSTVYHNCGDRFATCAAVQ